MNELYVEERRHVTHPFEGVTLKRRGGFIITKDCYQILLGSDINETRWIVGLESVDSRYKQAAVATTENFGPRTRNNSK